MSRTVIITGGGGWNDASVEQVVLPDDKDMAAEYRQYRYWISCLPPYGIERSNAWISFPDWLKKFAGATDAELEIFHED